MLLKNQYELQERLGGGNFGETHKAWDRRDESYPTGRFCVVKRLHYEGKPEQLAVAQRLFHQEAKALGKLGQYSQIPALYDFFTEAGEFYLVQEYVEGKTLDTELQEQPGGKFTTTQTVRLLQEILEVLAVVHRAKIIHRDLKPENMMRRALDGKVVLIDFGAVKQVTSVLEDGSSTVNIGSPGYQPAEQAQGKPRFASDIYAVGMMGLQCLTGVHPLGFGEEVRTGEIDWSAAQQGLDPRLVKILGRMIAYDWRQRYVDADEALEAFRLLEQGASLARIVAVGRKVDAGDGLTAEEVAQQWEARQQWEERQPQPEEDLKGGTVAAPHTPSEPTTGEKIEQWLKTAQQRYRLWRFLTQGRHTKMFDASVAVIGPRISGKHVYLISLYHYITTESFLEINHPYPIMGVVRPNSGLDALLECAKEGNTLPPRVPTFFDGPQVQWYMSIKKASINFKIEMFAGEFVQSPEPTIKHWGISFHEHIAMNHKYIAYTLLTDKFYCPDYDEQSLKFFESYLLGNYSHKRIAIMFAAFEKVEFKAWRYDPQGFAQAHLPKTYEVLVAIQNDLQIDIEYFAYSAFGFLPGTETPNSRREDPTTASLEVLQDGDAWKPFGLIEPLFWLATGHYLK